MVSLEGEECEAKPSLARGVCCRLPVRSGRSTVERHLGRRRLPGSTRLGDRHDNWGRIGSFPDGTTGFSHLDDLLQPRLAERHLERGDVREPPADRFLAVREDADRMVQVSDYSYLKHAFFALSNSQCIPCLNPSPNGNFLGIGCSDTYSTGNNGDRFWLAPAEEINPWLGTWQSTCSFFDVNCDGQRSYFGSEPNEVNAGSRSPTPSSTCPAPRSTTPATTASAASPRRTAPTTCRAREFRPTWTGFAWSLSTTGFTNPNTPGSVLARWTGASIESNTNAGDDGRVTWRSRRPRSTRASTMSTRCTTATTTAGSASCASRSLPEH